MCEKGQDNKAVAIKIAAVFDIEKPSGPLLGLIVMSH
jgi:hypothetical protein